MPHQVPSINNFIHASCADNPNLVGFGSLHPDYEGYAQELDRMVEIGLRGVKLHPDFQKFAIDDPKVPIYDSIRAHGLPILMHMGDDRYDYSHPKRLARMLEDFPGLVVIAAHFGGYQSWDEVPRYLRAVRTCTLTLPVRSRLSPGDQARSLIELIGEDRFFFGTDYPMWSPGEELDRFFALELTDAQNRKILYDNFAVYSILTDESTGFSHVFPHLRRDVSMESDNVRCRVLRFVANGDAWAGFPAFFAISCCLQIETDLYNKTRMYRRGTNGCFQRQRAGVRSV